MVYQELLIIYNLSALAALREKIIQKNNRTAISHAKALNRKEGLKKDNNLYRCREKSPSAAEIQFVFLFLILAHWRLGTRK